MEYQFAIIKSEYTFKRKLILTISFNLIMLVVFMILLYNNILDVNTNSLILIFYISLPAIFSYLFHKFVVERYKVIGTIIIDSDKLTILPENTVLEIEAINHIYYGNSSGGNNDRESDRSYFLQIELEKGKTILINVTRNQHNGKKFLKRKFFKRSIDLFFVFEKLEIKHSFKKAKNFLIQR